MPTTINQIFKHAGVAIQKEIQWGEKFTDHNQGVYIVAANKSIMFPDFDDNMVKLWITKLPLFQLDDRKPTLTSLKKRILEFWLPDEQILYIGKAPTRKSGSGLSKRLTEYFKTEIGDKGPHSGGQWIKTLKNLTDTKVYYGYTNEPNHIEKEMLGFFMKNISASTINNIRDKKLPLPFANLEYTKGKIKNHGCKNQRLK